jgi:ankyrin repeat protein
MLINFGINYSSGENTIRVLELLLKYNIRPNSFDLYTALDRNRQNSAIQFILMNGASPNGEILLLVMERQRFDLARQFIEAGADVNYRYPLSRRDSDGMTPLLYASKWGNIEILRLLVENGANINVQATNGDTALSLARESNNNLITNYLLQQGATEIPVNTPQQNEGIISTFNNQTTQFQDGAYRLSGGNSFLNFTGNRNSGSVSFLDSINNRIINGIYRINGNNLTITLDGFTFNYRLDTNVSFSGNGEVWVRTGN